MSNEQLTPGQNGARKRAMLRQIEAQIRAANIDRATTEARKDATQGTYKYAIVSADILLRAIKRCRVAIGRDETRPYFQQIRVELDTPGEVLRFVATDGHRLIHADIKARTRQGHVDGFPSAGTAASIAADDVRRVLAWLTATVKRGRHRCCVVGLDGRGRVWLRDTQTADIGTPNEHGARVAFKGDDVCAAIPGDSGRYPDWQRVVPHFGPHNPATEIDILDSDRLRAAIKSAITEARAMWRGNSSIVILEYHSSRVHVTKPAQREIGQRELTKVLTRGPRRGQTVSCGTEPELEPAAIKIDGGPCKVRGPGKDFHLRHGFNADYLLGMILPKGNGVRFRCDHSHGAHIIWQQEDEADDRLTVTAVLMPVRV